ncbi:type II secretion system protein GspM [Motiliproteus sp. MSK22-1]|uniref:type II secretion system protein GspM n=1 Tax=Motiliproteus sp. MSK22-1 TaxID=1897630 RepID=UPI0009787CEC|nr:type II secretion system protein GspM [Motiliproteus sp. MSK22-1]OMH34785.1 hypothetical protein BGP75_10795 [Motiliproteus sp. MSK22-1]
MSQPSTKFQSWLQSLTVRERISVTAGTFAVVATLIYLFVWQPQLQRHDQLSRQVEAKNKLLLWMERASSEVEVLRAKGGALTTTNNNVSAQQNISRLASTAGIRVNRSERTQSDHIRLRFDSIEFNRLLVFLDSAAKSGMVLSSINIQLTDKSGFVTARVLFEDS